MPRLHRTAAVVLLPLLTLALGWQLGARMERRELEQVQRHLERLYGNNTGSGTLVTDPEKQVDLGLFWNVWKLLLQEYIEPGELKPTPMLLGAVRGLVNSIGDPYTVFMDPKENQEFHEGLSGSLQGIGAELAARGGKIVIVSPLKGSPAERAGLMPEDVILEVNGLDMAGKTLAEVVEKVRGKKGTDVTIIVGRGSPMKEVSFTITRDDIHVPSVESQVKKTATGSVGVLTINQFGNDTVREATQALQNLKREKLKGIVIDLRFNGGGYLDGAVSLTSLFLTSGKVVTVQGRGAYPQPHYVTGHPLLPDIPLVVLINQGTASASEILAGALQDHKRATIVGMKSFGKGTVQEVIDLPGGSSLRVTTAHWLTPKGRNLAKDGIDPDVEIDRTPEDIEANRDPQMEKALEWITEK